MSTRNIRKLMGGNVLPPPEDDSDYEPLYAKATNNPVINKFHELCCSSSSESNPERETEDGKESEEEAKPVKKSQKKTKLKKKKQQRKKRSDYSGLDEIDRCIKETNELLGSPPPAPVLTEIEETRSEVEILFSINNKYLNTNSELRKLVGPDPEEEARNRRRRVPHYFRRGLIIPGDDQKFRKVGISMTQCPKDESNKDGYSYFTIDHDKYYQKHHRVFLKIIVDAVDSFPDLDANKALENMHVEEMLQVVDILFAIEEFREAKKLLETVAAYLQFISHPLFRITDTKVRLEYKVLENRVYHVAMLKYIYVLTNNACHRAALEISKILLNLDPSDPLALIIVVDMIALRAREYQWLIEAVEYWKTKRGADFMFNLLYSYALAKFHVINKKKGDLAEADAALHYAIKRYPSLVPELYKVTCNRNPQLMDNEMFKDNQQLPGHSKVLWEHLIKYYTLFTAPNWRESAVWAWFSRNAVEVVEQYKTNDIVQRYVKQFEINRSIFVRYLPQKIMRHLKVITFMNFYIFDDKIFPVRPGVASYNPRPWPEEEVNRYQYRFTPPPPPPPATTGPIGLVGSFLRSIAPNFRPEPMPQNDLEAEMPPRQRNDQEERDEGEEVDEGDEVDGVEDGDKDEDGDKVDEVEDSNKDEGGDKVDEVEDGDKVDEVEDGDKVDEVEDGDKVVGDESKAGVCDMRQVYDEARAYFSAGGNVEDFTLNADDDDRWDFVLPDQS